MTSANWRSTDVRPILARLSPDGAHGRPSEDGVSGLSGTLTLCAQLRRDSRGGSGGALASLSLPFWLRSLSHSGFAISPILASSLSLFLCFTLSPSLAGSMALPVPVSDRRPCGLMTMTVHMSIMAAAVAVRLGSAGEPEKMSPTGTQHINAA